jgi:hypothetical protein
MIHHDELAAYQTAGAEDEIVTFVSGLYEV